MNWCFIARIFFQVLIFSAKMTNLYNVNLTNFSPVILQPERRRPIPPGRHGNEAVAVLERIDVAGHRLQGNAGAGRRGKHLEKREQVFTGGHGQGMAAAVQGEMVERVAFRHGKTVVEHRIAQQRFCGKGGIWRTGARGDHPVVNFHPRAGRQLQAVVGGLFRQAEIGMPTQTDRYGFPVPVSKKKRGVELVAIGNTERHFQLKGERVPGVVAAVVEPAAEFGAFGRQFDPDDLERFIAREAVDGVVRGGIVQREGIILPQPAVTPVAQTVGEGKQQRAFTPFAGFQFFRRLVSVEYLEPAELDFQHAGAAFGYDTETIAGFGMVEGVAAVFAEGGLRQFEHGVKIFFNGEFPAYPGEKSFPDYSFTSRRHAGAPSICNFTR